MICPKCNKPAKLPAHVESDLLAIVGASVRTACCGKSFLLKQEFVLIPEHVSGRVIIAGSRTMPFSDYPKIEDAVNKSGYTITEVGCGMAAGADQLGGKWALSRGIPIRKFPADWEHLGRTAGFIRNAQMAEWADAAIIFMYGDSSGSKDMERKMRALRKPTFTVIDGEIDYAF